MSELLDPKIGIPTPYKLKCNDLVKTGTVKFDNIEFYTVRFDTNNKTGVRGRVLIVHGWCEHSHMYYRIMEQMSNLGYESFIFDQRGAGRTSLGKYRGRCGRDAYLVYKDIDFMIEQFLIDGLPFYLLSHLAGGGICLNYMVDGKYRSKLAGIITTGPMVKIADSLTPSPYIEYLLHVIAYWFPYLPWGSINRDPAMRSTITTADEWIDYLQQELLTQGNGTLGQIKYIFDRGYRLANFSQESLDLNPDFKLLILHAINDTMCSFEQLKLFFEKVPIKNKRFILYERGSHSLFIEKEDIFLQVCEDIEHFLAEEVLASPSHD